MSCFLHKVNMAKTVKHIINGTAYRVMVTPFDGICDSPATTFPFILLPQGVKNTKRSMELIIHECLHASDWNASEEKVGTTAKDISSLLWKLGFRLNETD